MIGLGLGGRLAFAEEPAAEFVRAATAAGYYDVALGYLDRARDRESVDAEFRSSVDFEIAQVHVAAAQVARGQSATNEQLQLAQQSFQTFIDQGDHPRRREAQMQLASLQKILADRSLIGDVDESARQSAREAYIAAGKTFETITGEIREQLQTMRGAKIDPSKDPDAAARRDRLRAEFLQGLVSRAESQKLAADTFEDPTSEPAKVLYEQAVTQFQELADKYSEFVSGAAATLAIGQIRERLGETEAAAAAYNEMLESKSDGLREQRFGAATGLMRLAQAGSPAELNRAIDDAATMAEDIRPDERASAAANMLQFTLAKSLIDRSKTGGDGAKRSLSDGRKILNEIVKLPGPHVEPAKALLSGLGINVDQDDELPTIAERPESTADAVATARQYLEVIAGLDETLRSTPPDQSDRRGELQQQIDEARNNATDLLTQGLAMVAATTDAAAILDARQLLAYTLSTGQRYRDAVVVGSSLAKLSPGTPAGLSGGMMALGSLQNLLTQSPSNAALLDRLKRLADYLAESWPNDPKAQSARSAVITLALQNNDYDKATEMIDALPTSREKASLQQLTGRMLYADAVAAAQNDDAAQSDSLRGRAEALLRDGLAAIAGDSEQRVAEGAGNAAGRGNGVEASVAKAALALAKIQLARGDPTASLATLDHPVYGAVGAAAAIGEDDALANQTYSTEIRAVIGTMTSGDSASVDAAAAMDRATSIMDKLQAANQGEQGAQRLRATYFTLARELRQEIDNAPPTQRPQLISALRGFLETMSASTDDPATLQWIGQTLMSLAEAAMPPGSRVATGDAAALLQTATQTLQRLSGDQNASPTILFQKAKGLRMLGQYREALDTLEKILIDKPSMLDAQTEAALAYEQYAAEVPERLTGRVYATALNGGRPAAGKQDGKKENVIWGWGKISLLTNGKPKFADKFFNARYHVALCRYLQGKAESDTQIMAKAVTDITSVAALYPAMGGPQQKKKFEDLLRTIQSELGQPPTEL